MTETTKAEHPHTWSFGRMPDDPVTCSLCGVDKEDAEAAEASRQAAEKADAEAVEALRTWCKVRRQSMPYSFDPAATALVDAALAMIEGGCESAHHVRRATERLVHVLDRIARYGWSGQQRFLFILRIPGVSFPEGLAGSTIEHDALRRIPVCRAEITRVSSFGTVLDLVAPLRPDRMSLSQIFRLIGSSTESIGLEIDVLGRASPDTDPRGRPVVRTLHVKVASWMSPPLVRLDATEEMPLQETVRLRVDNYHETWSGVNG